MLFGNHMAAARVVENQEISFCITVGNQRGRAAQPDGRRGEIAVEFQATRRWGEFLAERFITKRPLPRRFGALYVYCRGPEEGDVWEEVLSHTTTMPAEATELDAQAEVTIEALRESNALVTQRQQEVAQLSSRERQLQEQNANAERDLQAIRQEINANRAFLATERERWARELRHGEERLARETDALDEMLRVRRATAAAEETRIQASVEAVTTAAMKSLDPITDLCRAQVAERQALLEETGKSLEAEIGAARLVSERRQGMQIALTRTQQAHLELEEKAIEQLDSLVPASDTPPRETATDRLKDTFSGKVKEIDVNATIGGLFALFKKSTET